MTIEQHPDGRRILVCPVCDTRVDLPQLGSHPYGVAAWIGDALGTSADVMLATWAHQDATNLERALRDHLETHSVIEWMTALTAANRRIIELETMVPVELR